VTDPAALDAAMAGIAGVVHLAAIPAYRPEIPGVDFMHINVTGTFNVLEAAGKACVGKVVFASSDSIARFRVRGTPLRSGLLPIG
jgi:uronate dehydrogenase